MFSNLDQLPPDPILGLMTTFNADPNPNKVNLTVGVYMDADGHTPIFKAVKEAEKRVAAAEDTKTYIGMLGQPEFNTEMRRLMLGADHAVITGKRIASALTPGGCGALRMASQTIKRANPNATVWLSDPTWANHTPLMAGAGLAVKTYPYFDKQTHGIKFDAMMDTLKTLGPNDVVLLHASCHNPTGADLSNDQWDEVAKLAVERGFIPFLDAAYIGLGEGIDADAYGLRTMADTCEEMLIAASCSKNFGLYRERTGLVAMIGKNPDAATAAFSHLLAEARGSYSMPPSHGGAIVGTILTDGELEASWRAELEDARLNIVRLRAALADAMASAGINSGGYLVDDKGMFSILDLSKEQIERLRTEFGVYIVGSGRINIAGLNDGNLPRVAEALAAIV